MRPWTLLVFVVVFASGGLSGYFVGRSHVDTSSSEFPTKPETLEKFDRLLGFDATQRAAFEKLYDANHTRFVSVKMRVEPELAAIRSDVRSQIRALLREDQKARFDAYCTQRDRQRNESMK